MCEFFIFWIILFDISVHLHQKSSVTCSHVANTFKSKVNYVDVTQARYILVVLTFKIDVVVYVS